MRAFISLLFPPRPKGSRGIQYGPLSKVVWNSAELVNVSGISVFADSTHLQQEHNFFANMWASSYANAIQRPGHSQDPGYH